MLEPQKAITKSDHKKSPHQAGFFIVNMASPRGFEPLLPG